MPRHEQERAELLASLWNAAKAFDNANVPVIGRQFYDPRIGAIVNERGEVIDGSD